MALLKRKNSISLRKAINYYTEIMCYSTISCQYSKSLPERKANLCVPNYIPTETIRRLFSHPATSPQWTPSAHS